MRRVAIAPVVGILLAALTSTIGASGVNGAYTCSSSSSCLSANQSAPAGSTGAAIKGAATNSYGVRGVSTNSAGTLGQSASGAFMYPGVEGESTSTNTNSGIDVAGGFGLSSLTGGHTAQYGVYSVGQMAGLFGENTSNSSTVTAAGVIGNDVTGLGIGIMGETSGGTSAGSGIGVEGFVQSGRSDAPGTGILGEAGTAGPYNYYASDDYGGYFSADGASGPQNAANGNFIGLEAESTGVAANFDNDTSETEVDLADALTSDLLDGYANGKDIYIDDDTNIVTDGSVSASNVQASGDATYRQNGTSGSTLVAYGTRAAAPELEDVGDAHLVNGRAIVHIDAKLADVMDRHSVYHVFLTPDGDSKGLYVAQKTPTSFVVAEQQGGRSTMAFDYRIVATPYGHTRERLALAPPLRRPSVSSFLRHVSGKTMRPRAFVTPPDRALRASLGAQRYANLMAAKRKELARP